MARPYSIDLRERVVVAVEKGGLSRRRAAAQFGVGISTVIVWVRRFRKTGSLAPGQISEIFDSKQCPRRISCASHLLCSPQKNAH